MAAKSRLLALLVAAGFLVGGAPGCAPERPPAHATRAPGVTRTAQNPRVPSERRGPGEPAPAGAPAESPPPVRESDLVARYGGRRALALLEGQASYYGDSFAGRLTASGERYDPKRYTAAHRTLPFGSVLRVVRVDTGAAVYVRVTDRGPFGGRRRILDLSRVAAEGLHMIREGVADVRAEVLEYGPRRKR